MDTVTTLDQVLRQEVSAYAGTWTGMDGNPSVFYFVENANDRVYGVLAPQTAWRKRAELIMMARIVNDQVYIDIDKTDKPLRDALLQAGIPSSQIISTQNVS
jgi:hypothetical protein